MSDNRIRGLETALLAMYGKLDTALDRAEKAEAQIAEFKQEREVAWGFNAGFDEAKEQFETRAEKAEALLRDVLAIADRDQVAFNAARAFLKEQGQ